MVCCLVCIDGNQLMQRAEISNYIQKVASRMFNNWMPIEHIITRLGERVIFTIIESRIID